MSNETLPEQTWYFTFGSGQQYDGRYVKIAGTELEARDVMVRHFGTAWCDQYRSSVGFASWGLVELAREEWPRALVDRAINALSAFGVTTEREAGQLLPMWLHYREMTADDRDAVLRHYRTGSPR